MSSEFKVKLLLAKREGYFLGLNKGRKELFDALLDFLKERGTI